MDKTNLIASSNDFILLESQDISVVNELNRIRKDNNTLALLEKVLGKSILLFAITKDEFEKVKET